MNATHFSALFMVLAALLFTPALARRLRGRRHLDPWDGDGPLCPNCYNHWYIQNPGLVANRATGNDNDGTGNDIAIARPGFGNTGNDNDPPSSDNNGFGFATPPGMVGNDSPSRDNDMDSQDRFFAQPFTSTTVSINNNPPAPATNNVVDIMKARGMSSLYMLLYTAGLAEDLKAPAERFTVFAPTNGALPTGEALANFVSSEPLADLRNVLLNHVVRGQVIRSTDLREGATYTTMAGTNITVSLAGGAKVNNVNINLNQADLVADNGIVHQIQGLLMPFVETPNQGAIVSRAAPSP